MPVGHARLAAARYPSSVHVGYLAVWAVGGYYLACARFRTRLAK